MSDIPEAPDSTPTNPKGRVSNEDLLTAIIESEQRRDKSAAERHKVVVDKLGSLETRIFDTERRLDRVERHAFPERALWVLVLVLTTIGLGGLALQMYTFLHAPTLRTPR